MTNSKNDIRQQVFDELISLGFEIRDGELFLPDEQSKNVYRKLHEPAKHQELQRRQDWLNRRLPKYLKYFADGSDVQPNAVKPILIEVQKQWQHELFRIARLTWSLPFSSGFGRRMRFLIVDGSNDKLIGILCLQSPPLSFPVRDQKFNYPNGRKTEIVNQTMDIQTLGAIPPYNRLLGGKLVALAASSNEVRAAYRQKYSGRVTEMEERIIPAELVALTTTSAFGRSSIYNRLKYRDINIAVSIGYTEGYGTFHLERLYPIFCKYLASQGIAVRMGYGSGPRAKWQTILRALDKLGLSRKLMIHGLKREAFLFPLITNLKDYMEGRDTTPQYVDLPFQELANYWRERWLCPRAERVDGWHAWKKAAIKNMLILK